MGLFTKNTKLDIYSPVDGEIIDLSQVEDEVFSEKMMGDGIAIIPQNGEFVSPMDGELITVFPTGHAYGIASNNGVEILIHIGLDTVSLNGEGFDIKVKQNQKVKVGDPLVVVDIEEVEKKVPSIKTPLIFTSESMNSKSFKVIKTGHVKKGELILQVI